MEKNVFWRSPRVTFYNPSYNLLNTHTRTRDNVPTYYAIDNATIERRITMSAELGFLTPGRKDVMWVNHVTMGIHHDCVALDVVFIVACNRRKSARRKKIRAYS